MQERRFKPTEAHKLISPKRHEALPPEYIMNNFGIKKGEVIADLGAGNGYFTIPIAEKTKMPVFAIDIENEMLTLLKERASKLNVDNIHYIQSDLEDIHLKDDIVDTVIIAFVLHEVNNMEIVLDEVARINRKDGNVIILEWEAVTSKAGPPLEERISSRTMEQILSKKGYDIVQSQYEKTYYIFRVKKRVE